MAIQGESAKPNKMISTMRLSSTTLQLYANTWQQVMKKEPPTDDDVTGFFTTLPSLRDTLSCTVCSNLLTGVSLLTTSSCDHYACKDCQGKKREEKRTCKECKDWDSFLENQTLAQLLDGYRQFCRVFLKTRKYNLLLEHKHDTDPTFDAFGALDILQEGARRVQTQPQPEISSPKPPSTPQATATPEKVRMTNANQHIQNQGESSSSGSGSGSGTASGSGSGSDRSRNRKRMKQERVVQVYYQNQDEDSIDIKIEPVYHMQNSENSTVLGMQMEEDSNSNDNESESPVPSPVDPVGQDICDFDEADDKDEEILSEEESSTDRTEVEIEETGTTITDATEPEEMEMETEAETITSDIPEQPQIPIPIHRPLRIAESLPSLSLTTTTSTTMTMQSPITLQLPLQSDLQQQLSSIPLQRGQMTQIGQINQNQMPMPMQIPISLSSVSGVGVGSPSVMHISPRQFPLHSFVLTRPSVSLSNANVNVSSLSNQNQVQGVGVQTLGGRFPLNLGTLNTLGPQTIRLARFSLPDGRPGPLTMVRQVLNTGNQFGGGTHTITLPINSLNSLNSLSAADLMQKKIIVRPAATAASASATATAGQLQRWPDANTVLQYASGSTVFSQGQNPNVGVGIGAVQNKILINPNQNLTNQLQLNQQQQNQIVISSTSTSTSTPSETALNSSRSGSGVVLNTSSGKVMNSVYSATSSGVKQNQHQQMPGTNFNTSVGGLGLISSGASARTSGGVMTSFNLNLSGSGASSGGTSGEGNVSVQANMIGVVAGDAMSEKKLKIRLPKSKSHKKSPTGCRCGNAASQPGKLTCCGQRCPCYTIQQSCNDCKCRGCRNPHLPGGGKKLMQGINTVIDSASHSHSSTSSSSPSSSAGSASARSSPALLASSSISATSSSATNSNVNASVPIGVGPGPGPTRESLNPQLQPQPQHNSHTQTQPQPVNVLPLPVISSSNQIFTRIHQNQPGGVGVGTGFTGTRTAQGATTFSQLIPLSNFTGLSGFTIPISLISPANSALQQHQHQHGETIHLQNVHHININNE